MDEAEHCHRLALMHAGQLIGLGTVAELRQVFAGQVVLEVECPDLGAGLATLEGSEWVNEVAAFGTRLHVVAAERSDLEQAVVSVLAAAGNGPARAERIVPSLEDVFIHAIEAHEQGRGRS
jgi:ABC-2 type transport system ATP-binding protein